MTERFDRRLFLSRSAAAAGLVALGTSGGGLLASCSTSSSGGLSALERRGISHARPKPGGSLVFGTDAEEEGFDPASDTFDEAGIMYARTVFDPLAIVAADGSIRPYLAQSIVPNADYSSWTITMRPNLLFHDGTPCDARAVVGSFEHFLAGEFGLLVKPVKKVTPTGPLTVEVTLDQTWVPFPAYLAGGIGGQMAWIVAPAMIKNPNGADHPIGTGPFVFKEWVVNDHFIATRNPHYWRPGMPYLDSIEYRPIPSAESRVESLRAGTIDIMHTATPQSIVQFRDDYAYEYVDDVHGVVGEPDMNFIMLNMESPPLNDPRVRQAMAMAINRDEVSRIVDIGVNPPSNGPFVPGTPYYVDPGHPAYDPAKARALVAAVEHDTGKPVEVVVGSTPPASTVRSAEFLQNQLQAVGIKITLQQFEQAQLINNALFGKGFHAYLWRQFAAVDPDLNYPFWSPTEVTSFVSVNMARNTDPRVQAALEQGRTSSTTEGRIAAYQEVSKLFAQDIPYLWTDRAVWAVVARPSVQNFNGPTTPSGAPAYGMIVGTVWPTQIWMS